MKRLTISVGINDNYIDELFNDFLSKSKGMIKGTWLFRKMLFRAKAKSLYFVIHNKYKRFIKNDKSKAYEFTENESSFIATEIGENDYLNERYLTLKKFLEKDASELTKSEYKTEYLKTVNDRDSRKIYQFIKKNFHKLKDERFKMVMDKLNAPNIYTFFITTGLQFDYKIEDIKNDK